MFRWKDPKGISTAIFIVGLVAAILASSLISTVATTQLGLVQGPQGDTGSQGPQGIQGPQGEPGLGVEPGFLVAPAYDSGWFLADLGQWNTFYHGLNTTELFVYVIGREASWDIHQFNYGYAV